MDSNKLALAGLVQMPGYAVLLRYFEEGCKDIEADLLNCDPSDEKEILARHRLTVGAWRLLKEVTARVNRDVAATVPPPDEPTSKELDELYLKHL